MKRLGNGTGSVYKLSGNRQRPWAARKTVGWNEYGQPKYKFIGFYRTKAEAMSALIAYNKTPYSLDGETLYNQGGNMPILRLFQQFTSNTCF